MEFSAPSTSNQPYIDIAPLRTSDFMGRFKPPAYNDPTKFTRRIKDNLLYYQTNYFTIWFITCILAGFIKPQRMICGLISLSMLVIIYLFSVSGHPLITDFKRKYAAAQIAILIGSVGFAFYFFDIYLLLWGIMIPLMFIMMHALFRCRNLNNKITKHLESFGFGTTPMGQLLSLIGVEIK